MGRSGSLYAWLYPHLGANYDKKDGDRVGPHLFCKAVCILRIHKPNSVHPISPGGIQPAIIIALCSAICKNPALFSVKCIRNMLYFYAVCFCDIQQKSLCFQLFQNFFIGYSYWIPA